TAEARLLPWKPGFWRGREKKPGFQGRSRASLNAKRPPGSRDTRRPSEVHGIGEPGVRATGWCVRRKNPLAVAWGSPARRRSLPLAEAEQPAAVTRGLLGAALRRGHRAGGVARRAGLRRLRLRAALVQVADQLADVLAAPLDVGAGLLEVHVRLDPHVPVRGLPDLDLVPAQVPAEAADPDDQRPDPPQKGSHRSWLP